MEMPEMETVVQVAAALAVVQQLLVIQTMEKVAEWVA